jgi:hypothetical protein
VFGLYSLILSLFQAIPSAIGYYSFEGFDTWYAFFFLGIIAVVIAVYYFLIHNVDLIINWLKLDKGFDDDRVEFGNLDPRKIVSLATILIGGFLIVDYLPSFLYNCYSAFRNSVSSGGGLTTLLNTMDTNVSYFDWGISSLNLILGYILLTHHTAISAKLTKQVE